MLILKTHVKDLFGYSGFRVWIKKWFILATRFFCFSLTLEAARVHVGTLEARNPASWVGFLHSNARRNLVKNLKIKILWLAHGREARQVYDEFSPLVRLFFTSVLMVISPCDIWFRKSSGAGLAPHVLWPRAGSAMDLMGRLGPQNRAACTLHKVLLLILDQHCSSQA